MIFVLNEVRLRGKPHGVLLLLSILRE